MTINFCNINIWINNYLNSLAYILGLLTHLIVINNCVKDYIADC